MVVRKGNPKADPTTGTTWPAPGVKVVSPNPFSSGSAKWNLLAPYLWKSNGGTNQQAGLD